MIIHNGYEYLKVACPAVTLGIFDGVHSGHRELLLRLVKRAGEINGESVVLTFQPHPRLVLDKHYEHLFFLTTPDEKISLLEKTGIDHLVIINFTPEFSNIDAAGFIKNILVDKLGIRYLILGHDHHFGKNAKGDFDTINQSARLFNFKVERLDGLMSDDMVISSSAIRTALLQGRLDDANKWLGYDYFLSGSVVEGRKIGQLFGFPTANIKPEAHKLVPGNGVYAVTVKVDKTFYKGMLNIGTNPTVNPDPAIRSVEVNIFNFNENIYDKKIEVEFRKRLRGEIKFANTSLLIEQMNSDKEEAMKFLN